MSQQPVKNRYRLYIDETGDHAYNLLDQEGNKYLALLGAWFRLDPEYQAFDDHLEKFKRDIFGHRPDSPVILHRKDIINTRGPFVKLLDPEIHDKFNKGLIELIGAASFKMICVIIDKESHLERYHDPFHPYHYCLVVMLERYCGWLSYKGCVGDVMAEHRGQEENKQLQAAYNQILAVGTSFRGADFFKTTLTSKEIKFREKKHNIAGIQLADMLAHPIKQHCLAEEGVTAARPNNFGAEIVKAANSKFNCQEWNGTIRGYGRVLLK